MTIKDINDKIISDARIQAEKIIAQAEDNANNIIKKGEKEANNIKNIILYKNKQEVTLKKSKILTEANLKAKKTILLEKQKIIEDVFDKAKDIISNPDKYEQIRVEGMKFVRENHSVNNRVDCIYDLLKEIK